MARDRGQRGLRLRPNWGDRLILLGDLDAGLPMVEDALRRLRGLTHRPWYTVIVILLGGYAALQQRDLPRATRLFAEALDSSRDLLNLPSLLSAKVGLAGVALARGQAERAARLLGANEAARDAMGIKRVTNWLHAERITADVRAALVADGVRAGPVNWCGVVLGRGGHRGASLLPTRSPRAQMADRSSPAIPTSCRSGNALTFFDPPLSRRHHRR